RGELSEAEAEYDRAKLMAEGIGDKAVVSILMQGLGDLAFERGDMVTARKLYGDALRIRTESSERQTTLQTKVALAVLDTYEGRAADAERDLRKYREEFRAQKESDDELATTRAIVNALLAQRRADDAAAELKAASATAERSQNRLERLLF